MADFGWHFTSNAEVPPGDRTPALPAQGCDDPTCDLANAQVLVGDAQLQKGKFTVATDGQGNISVKNLTDEAWPALVNLYVYAPSKIKAGTSEEAHSATYTALTDHEARLAALEAAVNANRR